MSISATTRYGIVGRDVLAPVACGWKAEGGCMCICLQPGSFRSITAVFRDGCGPHKDNGYKWGPGARLIGPGSEGHPDHRCIASCSG